jgi:hypothetical protein
MHKHYLWVESNSEGVHNIKESQLNRLKVKDRETKIKPPYLKLSCCKKRQKKSQPRNWFGE